MPGEEYFLPRLGDNGEEREDDASSMSPGPLKYDQDAEGTPDANATRKRSGGEPPPAGGVPDRHEDPQDEDVAEDDEDDVTERNETSREGKAPPPTGGVPESTRSETDPSGSPTDAGAISPLEGEHSAAQPPKRGGAEDAEPLQSPERGGAEDAEPLQSPERGGVGRPEPTQSPEREEVNLTDTPQAPERSGEVQEGRPSTPPEPAPRTGGGAPETARQPESLLFPPHGMESTRRAPNTTFRGRNISPAREGSSGRPALGSEPTPRSDQSGSEDMDQAPVRRPGQPSSPEPDNRQDKEPDNTSEMMAKIQEVSERVKKVESMKPTVEALKNQENERPLYS